MSRAKARDAPTGGGLRNPSDFVRDEIDLLLHSAALRIEQQRIHIDELSGHIEERVRARQQLKEMLASYEKLEGYRHQFGRN